MASAGDIMDRAAVLLADAEGVRWPASELRLWINDGLREIALHAPQAAGRTVVLAMQRGTRQILPDDATSLLRVNANVTLTQPGDVVAHGRAVTAISRDSLDRLVPGWQMPGTLPFSRDVEHVIDDPLDARSFLVAPGNDGTGHIEALVSAVLAPIEAPGNPDDRAAYTQAIPLESAHINALLDYVMSRALSKDSIVPGTGERAALHYQTFAMAIGIKAQTEAALTPATTPRGQA